MADALAVQQQTLDDQTMLLLVTGGDCSRLSPAQKLSYYRARCDAAGLDPRTHPFSFLKLSGKEVLYALKAASDGLAAQHGIVCTILDQRTESGVRIVTVRATAKDGRQTEEIGAVSVANLAGEALCNAMMKAVTKAKRRATLGVCGLGMLDETEVESIPSEAQTAAHEQARSNDAARAAVAAKMPQHSAPASPWQRIEAAGAEAGVMGDDLKKLVKETTGKASAKELDAGDVLRVRDALEQLEALGKAKQTAEVAP